MFEHKTFDSILQEMLDRIPDDVDKLPGSIIYDALAPTAMELAETYANMDMLKRSTFADTADGEDLEMRVGELGVRRKKASAAVRKGVFTDSQGQPFSVPVGSRFRLDEIVYLTTELITPGQYMLQAETVGIVGNKDYGELLPVEPISGLGRGVLTEVLIPGAEEESDSSLYEKYQEHLRDKAFGGNRADYKKRIIEINGVGAVQLFRAPFGGGTVRAVIVDSDFNVPTPELVDLVQETIDPIPFKGNGYGTAPIGHEVLIEGAEGVDINISAVLSLNGVTLGQVEPMVNSVIDEYLAEVRQDWKKELPLVVRITHIESRILEIEGVEDIQETTINGQRVNLTLLHEIPIKGSVDVSD